jgi:hypothetical protein
MRIEMKDLLKAVKLLEKEANGGAISIRIDGVTLQLITVDRSGKEMTIELSDLQYPMLPRVTKTETF